MLIPRQARVKGGSREPAVSDVEVSKPWKSFFNSLFTYSNAFDSARVALGRRDILVHSEKVGWIELPLERGETRQLRPVCRPDSIRSFVAAQIIHVCALGEIGPEHIEKFARPGDVALRILRIGPGGGHDEIVRPRAMAESRGGFRHAIPGAVAVMLQHDHRSLGWDSHKAIDKNIDR